MLLPTTNPRLGLGAQKLSANSSLLFNAVNPLRLDPTRTTLIRGQFQAELRRRILLFRRNVRIFFSPEVDALALRQKPNVFSLLAQPAWREYQFLTDAGKLQAFSRWLAQQIDEDILRTVNEGWQAPLGSIATGPWTSKYIESAYRRGVLNAFLSARKARGEMDESQEQFLRRAFAQPELLSKVQLLATRSFEQLKGFTAQMAQELNRILAQGMADGRGPAAIAREMMEKIEGLTMARAMRIARTETIYAHAEGQLDSFEELEIEEIGLLAEWVTAGDNKVCPLCAALEGRTFTIDEARGKIPLHPNCRCSWTTVEAPKGKKK